MPAPSSKSSGKPRQKNNTRTKEKREEKRLKGLADLETLEKAVVEFDPKTSESTKFANLPLSEPTASGLDASHFQTLTEIQARAIPLALKGLDILGAAKTGSGKTLAFLVPVLEKLHRARWTEYDGLGALILSPTRELAVQIFEVLRKIGRNHPFSAGLVIGGKSLKEEAVRLARMNILVCTPGRMLQHLDQTAGFDASNLQILVLDEADRIMDMGFQQAVDALVEHLPKSRQTLMFSATQSKKVSDLARLSLKDPEYVSVHEKASTATPASLTQHYIITPLPEKINTLYGFLKSNLKSKMIVFLSSGKQVRFVYESFRALRPGIPLLHLHGRQKQTARLEITSRFAAAQYSCLFATDVVARGVDFPAVDWVVQFDCPEDADTYIHRVGRTARFQSNGRAVLFLDPSEEDGMLKRLEHKKVPIQKVNVKESKRKSIKNELQQLCFQNPDVKYLAQKSFISYTRSVHLQKDKEVFKFNELDLDGFAASMGLPGAPQIKFQKGEDIKKIKNASRMNMSSDSESEFDEEGNRKRKRKKGEVRTKYDKMFERTNQDVLSSHYTKLVGDGEAVENGDDGDEDNFLSVKRVLNDEDLDEVSKDFGSMPKVLDFGGKEQLIIDSKRREKLLQSKKKLLKYRPVGERLVFDDDGNPRAIYELKNEEDFKQEGPVEEQRRKFIEDEVVRVQEADLQDKMLAKQRIREKREKRKAREKEERELEKAERAEGGGGGMVVELGGGDDEDGADPLALLRDLPIAGGQEYSSEDEEEDRRPKKKAKKWFQDDESSADEGDAKKRKKKSKKGGKVIEIDREPETLEDLEALATGLLD
ncbi:ATP-dependent RNA helicase dbp-4 [Scedosporium apiospermum]|uniref:ATP-dependent RNA helicase n=1 Tax=Pseudallescheria apiosperma TaxID=563466 RepID=A0A084FZJ2_PSEDA|nr:ATP-dependent RNA helicase dbp-4 [Scedosporium apiospermum]KEZ40504.1 ATP-dependent RNA helicase dbp-4 [Scedosporium apiospermum]